MYIIYIHILYVPYLYHICTISPVSNGSFAILVDAIQRRYPTVPSLRAVGSQPVPFSDFSCRGCQRKEAALDICGEFECVIVVAAMCIEEELEEDDADADPSAGDGKARVKRKMAIVIGFIGTRYRGLMINPEVEQSAAKKSVEELIRVALVKANIVSELNSQKLEQKVSALRLVISARLLVSLESLDQDFSPELVDEINEGLPADIRCFSAKKVPNSFDAKHACSWREYEYILPTQLAQPLEGDSTLSAEVLAERLQGIMQRFEGCHSFHNFTRLKASDCLPRAEREKGGPGMDQSGDMHGLNVE
ncbi:unnamed protein product [Cladocopium goreaui]|uniref:tRNA pseudouridine synthase 1 (TRN A pseudouridylate synthase 1) (tRNA-uridine isomerase 1) n=1 Tax=Cladocopium goreaui TaxID=2562237 RepID=A0A9P1FP72_9DINO|nr:unnamed protein product [Cladocopium goreaui]